MNYVTLLGRLVKNVDFRYSQQGTAVAQITLAVDRFANGEKKADFIPVILLFTSIPTIISIPPPNPLGQPFSS